MSEGEAFAVKSPLFTYSCAQVTAKFAINVESLRTSESILSFILTVKHTVLFDKPSKCIESGHNASNFTTRLSIQQWWGVDSFVYFSVFIRNYFTKVCLTWLITLIFYESGRLSDVVLNEIIGEIIRYQCFDNSENKCFNTYTHIRPSAKSVRIVFTGQCIKLIIIVGQNAIISA